MPRRRAAAEDGQLTVLVIGYTFIAAALIVVAIDVSSLFLARRALSSAADSAALAAAQQVDRAAVYSGSVAAGCGLLPIEPDAAQQAATDSFATALDDLHKQFRALDEPRVDVAGGRVTVHAEGDAAVPFVAVLRWLDPGRGDGLFRLTVDAAASSPLTGTIC